MMLLSLLLLFTLVSCNRLGRRTMAIHESCSAVPPGFVPVGAVSPTTRLTLRIALTNSNIDDLEKIVYQISDPASEQYGQHLTKDQVTEYVKPSAEALSAISEWLSEHEISATGLSNAGDMLQITVSVDTAEELLSANFSEYRHVESGADSIRTLAYSVPASLKQHIQFIHPTISFTPPPRSRSGFTVTKTNRGEHPREIARIPTRTTVPESCATLIEPLCLKAMYGIPSTVASHSANNVLGVPGYSDQFANFEDLQSFLTKFRPDLDNSTKFTVQSLNGGENDQTLENAGIEADLDVEYTIGLAAGVPVTFISTNLPDGDFGLGLLDTSNALISQSDDSRPKVLSTSYGIPEPWASPAVATALCRSYMQLGAMGTSVIFSSGDGGVSGSQTRPCDSNNRFVPTFPPGCPFVTSVGGTTGLPPQSAWPLSSGGFSDHFRTPKYQARDVSKYIASLGTKYSGLYNKTGRGFPDVAAQAEHIQIQWRGAIELGDGTSASCPIFASMISLLNDRLIAAGRPVLGFLNPLLYSEHGRAAFTDVTSGNNPGCNTDGFSASPGWDPLTGLGTPNFDLFLRAVGL
ncbi:family S53 protease [Mycena rebaudengoi]|nr:family S53 protease [Mycena rebaudengoi]